MCSRSVAATCGTEPEFNRRTRAFRGSRGLKVKFKFSLSPKANIVMYIHIHSDILTGYRLKVYVAESPN